MLYNNLSHPSQYPVINNMLAMIGPKTATLCKLIDTLNLIARWLQYPVTMGMLWSPKVPKKCSHVICLLVNRSGDQWSGKGCLIYGSFVITLWILLHSSVYLDIRPHAKSAIIDQTYFAFEFFIQGVKVLHHQTFDYTSECLVFLCNTQSRSWTENNKILNLQNTIVIFTCEM